MDFGTASYRWLARYRSGSASGLADRSSAPQRCKHRIGTERVGEIERLRRQRTSGPAIARQLSMPVSRVGRDLAPARSGQPGRARPEAGGDTLRAPAARRVDPSRYQGAWAYRGDRTRISGRTRGAVNRHHGIGWEALHVFIDDATRWLIASTSDGRELYPMMHMTPCRSGQAAVGGLFNLRRSPGCSPAGRRRRETGACHSFGRCRIEAS
jgi:hypothetical protein